MEGYSVKIRTASKDLTHTERVQLKDTTNATGLDQLTQDGPVVLDIAFYAILDIHNEKSENKDYDVYIIVDKNGTKYKTSSENFMNSFEDIMADMSDSTEPFQIKVYVLPSKNRSGQTFLTCSLI